MFERLVIRSYSLMIKYENEKPVCNSLQSRTSIREYIFSSFLIERAKQKKLALAFFLCVCVHMCMCVYESVHFMKANYNSSKVEKWLPVS